MATAVRGRRHHSRAGGGRIGAESALCGWRDGFADGRAWCVGCVWGWVYRRARAHTVVSLGCLRACRWYVIAGMIVGAAIFSYVIGTICTLVQGLMVTSLEFQGRMDLLATYMQQYDFPIELRARANQFCFYSNEVHKSLDGIGDKVTKLLSPAMRKEAAVHIYGDTLTAVGMFQHADELFIADIAMKLRTTTYAPMEYVFNEGAGCEVPPSHHASRPVR